jgi:hypothetical protein
MPLVKTSELTGPALDWAVAECEFPEPDYCDEDRLVYVTCELDHGMNTFSPSTNWAQGGPIIEQLFADYQFGYEDGEFFVGNPGTYFYGPTPLIAAMRCYVASQLGDIIDIPTSLQN